MKIVPIKNLVHNTNEWNELSTQTQDLTNKVIQDVNFTTQKINWEDYNLSNTTFLGCNFKQNEAINLIER